ncbi:Multidrug resistance-associated protein 4 [Trachymyrmex septentrionalis]|uniref:Multidrug resistance-associated protein 4 n=1 Tax=Trachymyrmex septentrionalis TaxID=34720 RepID=A0A151JYB2_9HYME|nr:Multidrug resistance-associated protein 4 [Trachymyrmex septentrionalis]
MGNNLTADVTYEMLTYFNILQLVVALYFSQGLLGESIVSFNRLEIYDFLLMDEVNTRHFSENTPQLQFKSQKQKEETNAENQIDRYISKNGSIVLSEHQRLSDLPVKLQGVSANWISGQLRPTLCNINLTIKPGQLCAVVGAVGSGKSSILYLLLKELNFGTGSVILTQSSPKYNFSGNLSTGYFTNNPSLRISYASQEPWLFGGSKCALMKDFRQFPQGDMTMVSDRDVSLSGGQRARINLARAVYRQADIYLRHIVVLDRGFVKMQGNYNEFVQSNKDFIGMLDNLNQVQRKKSKKITITRQISRLSTTSSIAHSDTDNSDYVKNISEAEMSAHGSLPWVDLHVEPGLLSTMDAIHVYTFCIIACIATTLFRSFLYMMVSMNSSSNFYNIMFFKLLACMSFFHNNPSGDLIYNFQRKLKKFEEIKIFLIFIYIYIYIKATTLFNLVNKYTSILTLIIIASWTCNFFLVLYSTGNVADSKAGLAISQSLILIVCLQYTIKQFIESVSLMTSVERILQYTNLPKEEPITADNPSPPTWQSQGQLILKNVNMKYHNLNISIESGWKVWVVGRTGKSSLISALFQLICLARAIFRNNHLLVLDETTVNIDSHTNALIQDTIRSSFKECTVITTAHCLNTIIDSNQIIVMENGSIVEFGCPYELLHDKPIGHFSQMVEKTSNQMAQSFVEQAKKACEKNNDHCELNLSAQNTACESDTTLTEQTTL